jgi:hypothetical protein
MSQLIENKGQKPFLIARKSVTWGPKIDGPKNKYLYQKDLDK